MGAADFVKDKITPQFIKDAEKALTPGATPAAASPAPDPSEKAQKAYEAREKAANAKNPYYVPRAKGGCVSKGGAPMMNVDKPVKIESFKGKG
jgi:hypothetical protein